MNRRPTLILDYIFLGTIISIITLQFYFMHGEINFFETGQYLPQINELFHGKMLYRDTFVMRGPFEIFMPAFLMSLFGKHIGVLNAYFYFGTVVTLIIYTLAGLRIFSTRRFVYLFTLVLTARTFPWSCFATWGGIRFGFGILALVLGIAFLRKRYICWLFFAGLISALAFWTSFEIGVFSFISVIAMLCLHGYFEIKNVKEVFKYMTVYITGSFIASLPFLIYLFSQNAFIPYIQTTQVVLTDMTKVFDSSLCFDTPRNFKEFLLALSPLNHNFKYTLPFFFYGGVGIYLWRRFVKNKISIVDISIVPVFIYGLLLYKGSFRDIEGPQYRMALQPLLLIMFFYLEHFCILCKGLKERVNGLKKVFVIFLLFAIPLYAFGFSISKYSKRFFIFKEARHLILHKNHIPVPYASPHPTPLQTVRARGIIVPGAQATEIDGVVKYIISHTENREPVFTFPDLGTYNFLTDRPSVGKFYCAELSFMNSQWFEEMLAELKTIRPRFIICAKEFSMLKPLMPTVGEYLEAMNQFLTENYSIKMSIGTVNIFERKI